MFKFHYPARGRKRAHYSLGYALAGSNSITPQGDGNISLAVGVDSTLKRFKFHYPARGRKPNGLLRLLCHIVEFKFHYPARGRKPSSDGTEDPRLTPSSNSITPQGDGNEGKGHAEWGRFQGSNSITPQGDGNNLAPKSAPLNGMVQIPLPRKGTETPRSDASLFWSPCSNSITPQGDGNLRSTLPSPNAATCSNSITPQGDGNVDDFSNSTAFF